MNNRKKIIIKLESYMKLKNVSKQDLAKKWKKSDAYIYRRFSDEVDFSLTDIIDIINILNLSKDEGKDIFFN
ncbi:MAG: helix-turn-helix domain-containing protein [Clostridia bacterium]